jgi:hypothetical protein
MQRTAIKAAYYSAAFILRSAMASRLDVDPDELRISTLQSARDSNELSVNRIVMSDVLDNGAGFCKKIGEEGYDELLGCIKFQDFSRHGYLAEIKDLIDESHAKNCSTSGYCCLHEYKNQPYHSVLDWRLGLSLLRVMSDSDFGCGVLDGPGSNDAVTRNVFALLEQEVREFCETQDLEFRPAGQLSGFIFPPDNRSSAAKHVLAVHPLWDYRGGRSEGLTATQMDNSVLATAMSEIDPEMEPDFVDLFNLVRRPNRVFDWLQEEHDG